MYDLTIGLTLQRTSTLAQLLSKVRPKTIIDKWSPYEIALFESAICVFGKKFHWISNLLKNKTTNEVVEFYYIWKKTKHGKVWKDTYIKETLQ